MIQYIKRKNLDVDKYDKCIQKSLNSRVYAFSWYLDIVADNWDALILNDYEVVMPLPWRQKYFIKYIYPPAWTQQLGVFSSEKIQKELILDFIKSIPKKFRKITIQFNSENRFIHENLTERINYILPLSGLYEEIYKGFNNNRKRDLKKAKENKLYIKEVEIGELIAVAKSNYSILSYTQKDYDKLIRLIQVVNKVNKITLLGVFSKTNDFLGGSLFFKNKNRLTYLFSVVNEKGKKEKAIGYLIDKIINDNSKSNFILDFEGSMNENIAKFFKTFGAKKENYSLIKRIRVL